MKKIIFIFSFCFFLLSFIGQVAIAKEIPRIVTPEDMVKVFYQYLFSEVAVSDCPEIFAEPTSYVVSALQDYKNKNPRLSDTAIIWKFLRDNKKLFLFASDDPISNSRSFVNSLIL